MIINCIDLGDIGSKHRIFSPTLSIYLSNGQGCRTMVPAYRLKFSTVVDAPTNDTESPKLLFGIRSEWTAAVRSRSRMTQHTPHRSYVPLSNTTVLTVTIHWCCIRGWGQVIQIYLSFSTSTEGSVQVFYRIPILKTVFRAHRQIPNMCSRHRRRRLRAGIPHQARPEQNYEVVFTAMIDNMRVLARCDIAV